MLHWNSER